MRSDKGTERTQDKLKKIEMGLKCIRDLNLLDDFYDETWKEGTEKFLNKYEDTKSFYDIPLEETGKVIESVTEWFGDDYGGWLLSTGNSGWSLWAA